MHFPTSRRLQPTMVLCAAVLATASEGKTMFTEATFSQIRFLEGKWKGVGPDGKEFFDEYVLEAPSILRSVRHADSSYSKATDASTVTLKNGAVVSTRNQFTWRASSISATKACLEPINAPSAFCWEKVAPDTVTVTQRWNLADGKEQSFVIRLVRFKN